MIKHLAVRVLAAVLAHRGVAYAALVLVNGVHAVLHGTPLDGGTLDGCVATIDQFCIAAIT